MIVDDKAAAVAAKLLDEAERARTPIRMVSLDHPGMGMEDAYRIQNAWKALKLATGRRVIGHKIGLTSKAMQNALGIDQPDSGFLLDDMLFADGGVVPTERFIGLRVEAELAVVMKADLHGPGCNLFDVLRATEYVVPSLELLDTRYHRKDPATGVTRTVFDTISDNASNAGIIVGGRPFKPDEQDLRRVGAICSKNGAVEETGLAAGVLNHPAMGVAWLADRLAQLGQGLKAGQIVLSGSFIRPIEVGPGDTINADYGPFGTVSCYFE